MKEYTTNKFNKGVNTDMSWLERQGDMLLDALNVRITSKNNDGLFAANIKGNIEEFSLSPGFVPIGSTEYNGILFILSVNKNTGFSEIGTYPKPNGISQGFTRIYSPLNNYTTDNPNIFINPCEGIPPVITRSPFTTEDLNFSCEHQARVLARLDFDKTINIYWTDNFNPIRSINTGFHSETGEEVERYVSSNMIKNGIINVISENEFIPQVRLANIPGTYEPLNFKGKLKAGHYFFFVRYTDIAFNSSSFIGMSSAVPVFSDNLSGSERVIKGLENHQRTNRDVNLEIDGLDVAAAFIEIGYIFYFEKDQYEIKLIDARHAIAGQSKIYVNVNGYENLIDLSLDEFVAYKPTDSLYCKDIEQLDNRLYLANTRGIPLDHPDIRDFFCKITIRENYVKHKKVVADTTFTGVDGLDNLYSSDPIDVHENVGYFSGETYIFGAVPIFKGGFTGPAFPLTGYDNIDGTYLDENKNGIFRFSKAKVKPFHVGDDAFIKGVEFNTVAATAAYLASSFLQENLIGVYFTRGEREPNLMYQGLMVKAYNWEAPARQSKSLWDQKKYYYPLAENIFQYDANSNIPLMEPFFPSWMHWNRPASDFTVGNACGLAGGSDCPANQFGYGGFRNSYPNSGQKKNEYQQNLSCAGHDVIFDAWAVFSLDYFLDEGQGSDGVGSTSFIEPIAAYLASDWLPRAPGRWDFWEGSTGIPNPLFNPVESLDGLLFVNTDTKFWATGTAEGHYANTHNVKPWDAIGVTVKSRRYVSKFDEGKKGGDKSVTQGFFYGEIARPSTDRDEYLVSLPVATPSYILIEKSDEQDDSIEWCYTLVNVCRLDPETFDYKNTYDFKNTFFSPISSFISTKNDGQVSDISDDVFYQGDCFIARSYLKVLHGHTQDIGDQLITIMADTPVKDDVTPRGSAFHEFGITLGIVTENAYNPYYRVKRGLNDFFLSAKGTWLSALDSPESFFYNTGYQRILGPRQFVGLDILKPTSDNSFPTRIRASFKHILNSLQDGYLQFADSKDFDFQYGPINALSSMGDQLFSFQNDAINMHPINERAVSQSDTTDTPFILGESKGLTEFKKALSTEYGTQHQWSIVKGERGLYGFDWNKQVFWRVSGEGFQNLGLLKGCEKWIEDIVFLQSTGYSDIMEQLADNPVCNVGIHSVYDREYKEVITTFIFAEEENNRTISFSEKADIFGAKYSFTPIFYSELERDLYSFKDGKFWRHDANNLYDNFYGQQEPAFVEVVVNSKGEIAKHFDNLIINSNNREFEKVTYTTQHQSAIQDPFLGEFWNRAVYREFQWKLPIRRADNIVDPQLSLSLVKSRIRGRYLIINLQYAGAQDMWVREIITAYTQSKA